MRAILAGGGTGGHINPAIAIANAICEKYPDSEILFIGTKRGLEGKLVPQEGYKIEFVNVEGFFTKSVIHGAVVLGKLGAGILKCMAKIKKFKPDVVVGTGGYASAPMLIAASLMHIPTVIHEQNAIAGKTSKLLSKMVDRVCVAFDNINLFGCPEKTVVTGNPIRKSFSEIDVINAKKQLGMSENLPLILCVSGSLGSEAVNKCMTEYIIRTHMEYKYQVITVTGDFYINDVKEKLENAGVNLNGTKIQIKNYINDMEKYLAAADIIISRAGAIFLSEIAYLGKPAILIPSPNVAENHQEKNADAVVAAGAAVKICERELTTDVLYNAVEELINNPLKLKQMSKCSAKLGIADADKKILQAIEAITIR